MSLKQSAISPLTRRRFLAAAGAVALAAKAPAPTTSGCSAPRFAYAVTSGEIRVYATHTTPWTHIQTVTSEAPASLVINARTHTLHVLHGVAEYQGLPCGYIESFRINHATGRLTQLSRQPLSLSAIHPRHMALSPDGKTLAIAVHGGSAYNLLPILEDGRPGRPIAIRKEISLSAISPSHPCQLAFHPDSSRIFALDRGTASVSVFAATSELPVLHRFKLPAGASPSHLALHPAANLLFISDEKTASLFTLRHDLANDSLSFVSVLLDHGFQGPLAVHAASETLVAATADSIETFRIDPHTAELSPSKVRAPIRSFPERTATIHSLTLSVESSALHVATNQGIWYAHIDSRDAALSMPTLVAPPARSIAWI